MYNYQQVVQDLVNVVAEHDQALELEFWLEMEAKTNNDLFMDLIEGLA